MNSKILLLIGIMLTLAACQAAVETSEAAESVPANMPEPTVTEVIEAVPEATTIVEAAPTAIQPQPAPTEALIETEVNEDMNGNADVQFVRAVQQDETTWTFYVTVAHPDTGWEDYADGWDVVLPDGSVVKPDESSPFTRLLLHPHVDEQPFTRSQNRIMIPVDVSEVRVRAHDLVDGFGGREVLVDLTVASGEDFSVERLQ